MTKSLVAKWSLRGDSGIAYGCFACSPADFPFPTLHLEQLHNLKGTIAYEESLWLSLLAFLWVIIHTHERAKGMRPI